MLIFRKVDVSTDIDQFVLLMKDLTSMPDDLERIKAIIERYNKREDAYLLVVEDDQKHQLVGSLLAILVEDYTEELRPLCYIENVVVKKEYQNKGIGKSLFEYIDQWAKMHHVNYELLVSANERIGAHRFYEHIGFTNVKGYKKFF